MDFMCAFISIDIDTNFIDRRFEIGKNLRHVIIITFYFIRYD